MSNNFLDLNVGVDIVDNKTTDDHYTPPFIFEALKLEFDIDVAAPVGGVPWIPAKKHYSLIDDGLTSDWKGLIWCNPPYSKITPWALKMLDHGNGIALLPVGKSQWFDLLWKEADGILGLPSTLRFIKSDQTVAGIMTTTVLFSFGKTATEALRNSGLGRMR
jgi:hypothetical protein